MERNEYIEEFKIDVVKQYLQGRKRKEICEEYGIAKSTIWGWVCKYADLVQKTWEVKGIEKTNHEFVDITIPMKQEYREGSMIKTTNETIRVFKNGYSILCHISKLARVMRIINDD